MRGSEEGGMVMGEEEEKCVYCHRATCQRAAHKGGKNREKEPCTGFGGEFGFAEAALYKTSHCYYTLRESHELRSRPGIIYDMECKADSI